MFSGLSDAGGHAREDLLIGVLPLLETEDGDEEDLLAIKASSEDASWLVASRGQEIAKLAPDVLRTDVTLYCVWGHEDTYIGVVGAELQPG